MTRLTRAAGTARAGRLGWTATLATATLMMGPRPFSVTSVTMNPCSTTVVSPRATRAATLTGLATPPLRGLAP
eukprot:11204543-Lingulodinium_polyedra.AAC.1